ncbi:hypothetical protein M569_01166 [Genlisea aurea]|uniref:Uncharacterized protein n=1 Tax=Genlisea aurea TaxID=192259 RepID=S8D1D7_9LAMI|nr:hypothetical protein M569_01166 [Genlisea aurea]
MRNKVRKRTACSVPFLLCCSSCTIAVILILVQLYTLTSDVHQSDDDVFLQELETVEEETMQVSLPKRRPSSRKKRRHAMIDEILNKSRDAFFPPRKLSVDPRKDTVEGNDSLYYFPGRVWLDTDGNPIQAHGGGILYDHISSTYYWYGEYKDGPTYRARDGPQRVDVIGVGCYSSKDLWTWRNEGIVLAAADEENVAHDLHKSNVVERPKVIFNERTGKYVMWMHVDNANYSKSSVGIATSDSPTGPFVYLHGKRPHGHQSRDMTVFKDDDEGIAYLIYSSQGNSEIHIGPLTSDYTDVTPVVTRVLVGSYREAPAVFKHRGTYYMITSGCTGWAPNEALLHRAGSMMGRWEMAGNPCVGGNEFFRATTFYAQGTFVMPLHGLADWFVFMADRWDPNDLGGSRYVWLPLRVGGGSAVTMSSKRVSVFWHGRWRLPPGWRNGKTTVGDTEKRIL